MPRAPLTDDDLLAHLEDDQRAGSYANRRAQYLAQNGVDASLKERDTADAANMQAFEHYDTPSRPEQQRLQREGGIYASPADRKFQQENEPEKLLAALADQRDILTGGHGNDAPDDSYFKGTGAHGEAYFTNSRELAKEAQGRGQAHSFHAYDPGTHGGTVSNLGGRVGDEPAKREKLDTIDDLITETQNARRGPSAVLKEFAAALPVYEGHARQHGYIGARQQMLDDASTGKLSPQAWKMLDNDLKQRAKSVNAADKAGGMRAYDELYVPATSSDAARYQAHIAKNKPASPLNPDGTPGPAAQAELAKHSAIMDAQHAAVGGGPGVAGDPQAEGGNLILRKQRQSQIVGGEELGYETGAPFIPKDMNLALVNYLAGKPEQGASPDDVNGYLAQTADEPYQYSYGQGRKIPRRTMRDQILGVR